MPKNRIILIFHFSFKNGSSGSLGMPQGSQEQNSGITFTKGLIDRYLTEDNNLVQPSNLTKDLKDSRSLGKLITTSPLSGWLD